jgi:glycosyltransferase involved in cell wall biosynthesis
MAGGWDLDAAAVYRTPGPTSHRRTIALKGREGGVGRAGVALEALRRCGDLLTGYTLELYMTSSEFLERASRLTRETGIAVKPLAGTVEVVPQPEVLALHGRSRISIALSIADAASTSMLEAMIMGSFPIQSDTACADEWIEDGVSGLIVPPEDPEPVAKAIRRALTGHALVDHASRINEVVALQRLDFNVVRDKAVSFYEEALAARAGGVDIRPEMGRSV